MGEHYPDAVKWASPKVRSRAAKHDIHFDKDLGDNPEPEWSQDINQIIIRGPRAMSEVEFFHKASQTLILTDFIENFERERLHSRFLKFMTRLAGLQHPDGKIPIDIYLTTFGRKKILKTAIQTLIDWHPKRVIIAHGKWYAQNGEAELRRAFRRLGTFD